MNLRKLTCSMKQCPARQKLPAETVRAATAMLQRRLMAKGSDKRPGQDKVTIRGPEKEIEAFRKLCEANGHTYLDFLRIAMPLYKKSMKGRKSA